MSNDRKEGMGMTMRSRWLQPTDFNLSIAEEANRLMHAAMYGSAASSLDPTSAFWVMRDSAWRDLVRSMDFINTVDVKGATGKFFMGLRVRVTHDDDDDTPMIQLVMEPAARGGMAVLRRTR